MQGDNIPLAEMRRVQREEKRRLLRTPHEEWKARQRAQAEARQPPPQRKVEALKIKKSRITEVPVSIYTSSEEDTTGSDSMGPHSESPVPSASQKKEETTETTTTASSTTTTTTTTKVKHKKLRMSKTT